MWSYLDKDRVKNVQEKQLQNPLLQCEHYLNIGVLKLKLSKFIFFTIYKQQNATIH